MIYSRMKDEPITFSHNRYSNKLSIFLEVFSLNIQNDMIIHCQVVQNAVYIIQLLDSKYIVMSWTLHEYSRKIWWEVKVGGQSLQPN